MLSITATGGKKRKEGYRNSSVGFHRVRVVETFKQIKIIPVIPSNKIYLSKSLCKLGFNNQNVDTSKILQNIQ